MYVDKWRPYATYEEARLTQDIKNNVRILNYTNPRIRGLKAGAGAYSIG